MIASLKSQIKLLLNFIKSYWFLTGIFIAAVIVAEPWASQKTKGFLTPIIKKIHVSENKTLLVQIDSVYNARDSIRDIEQQNMLTSAFANNNNHQDSLAETIATKRFLSIITDTIPRFKNGKKDGYYLIMMLPDGTPIVNEFNSIFFNPNVP